MRNMDGQCDCNIHMYPPQTKMFAGSIKSMPLKKYPFEQRSVNVINLHTIYVYLNDVLAKL